MNLCFGNGYFSGFDIGLLEGWLIEKLLHFEMGYLLIENECGLGFAFVFLVFHEVTDQFNFIN
jgi:hypothetical protein